MQNIDKEQLNQSIAVARRAYAPYSKFLVGALLVATDGRTFAGCNVENISFGLTICAERSAVAVAVSSGCREFERIIIAADTEAPVSPCGACRQVLAEFNPDLEIVLTTFSGRVETFRLSALLPRPSNGILHHP
jgi:cytidine deaminase